MFDATAGGPCGCGKYPSPAEYDRQREAERAEAEAAKWRQGIVLYHGPQGCRWAYLAGAGFIVETAGRPSEAWSFTRAELKALAELAGFTVTERKGE